MKLTIKVKEWSEGCLPQVIEKGDWIDLRSAQKVSLKCPNVTGLINTTDEEGNPIKSRDVIYYPQLISLGVSMKLPAGYEAIIAPRSSSYKKFGFIQCNSIGIIDQTYCGTNDIWKMCAIPMKKGVIEVGDRICQFRIQLSQKATIWQKIKWLFTSKIEFDKVEILDSTDRGGFGSTGK